MPSSISSKPTYSPAQTIETFTQSQFQRMLPLALTVPNLEAIGILKGWKCRRHVPWRPFIDRSRRLLIEGLVRALVVVFRAEVVESALLGRKAGGDGQVQRGTGQRRRPPRR